MSPSPQHNASDLPAMSVVLAVRNEEHGLERVLDSVFNQDYPNDRLEVIVVDGQSTDRSVAIVEQYARSHPACNVRIVANPKRITPCAFNLGIQAATGEFVAILGAHTAYSPDYLRRAAEILARSEAFVVGAGGTCQLVPGAKTSLANAIANVLTHPFGRGGSHQQQPDGPDVIVPAVLYPVWRKSVFDTVGYYDERMIRSQDNEFNARVRDAQFQVVLSQKANAEWRARRTVRSLARWAYDYGYYHFPLLRIRPTASHWKYFVPAGLVLAMLSSTVAALLNNRLAWIPLAVFGVYALACLIASTHILLTRPNAARGAAYLPMLFGVFHVCYGIGVLHGFFSPIGLMKRPRRKTAAAMSSAGSLAGHAR